MFAEPQKCSPNGRDEGGEGPAVLGALPRLSATASLPRHSAVGTVVLTLGGITATAWIYVVRCAGLPGGTAGVDMTGDAMMAVRLVWTVGYAASVFVMWVAMMAAMMLPSAAPAAVRVGHEGTLPGSGRRAPAALVFAAGYLAVWVGFSAVATALQWGLDSAQLLSETLAIRGTVAAGVLLIAAGLYQVSPWTHACLRRCGAAGNEAIGTGLWAAARRGVRYGATCLGCCAALMALLFVGGAMNALWMALIAAWVFAEKTFAWGGRIAMASGAALVAWGAVAITAALR